MAILMDQFKKFDNVIVISENDDAVDHELSDFNLYQQTGDLKHLEFKPDTFPTKFVCNFELKGKQSAKIKNAMIGGYDDESKRPKVSIGDWSFTVVKYVLKDIQNPDSVPSEQQIKMRWDKDGYVHDDVLCLLERCGVLSEIFAMYSSLVGSSQARENVKN